MENGEKFTLLFTNEFIAGSRAKAVELMGEKDVAGLDSAISEFAEDEIKYDSSIALDFLTSISADKLKFNNYPIICFANTWAKKENPKRTLEEIAERILEIISELEDLRQGNE